MILCARLIMSIYTNQSPGAAAVLPQAPPAPGHGLRVAGALQEGLRGLQDRPADRHQRAGGTRQRQQVLAPTDQSSYTEAGQSERIQFTAVLQISTRGL